MERREIANIKELIDTLYEDAQKLFCVDEKAIPVIFSYKELTSDILYAFLSIKFGDVTLKNIWENRIEPNTDDICTHSVDVCLYSMALSYIHGLSCTDVIKIGMAGLLHDIGKRYIPVEILKKNSKLTEVEFSEIKKHPILGKELTQRIYPEISEDILDLILLHHEKINGTGYPLNSMGEELNDLTRIITIADMFDAYTLKRNYHEARTIEEGFDFLKKQNGLDQKIVNEFQSLYSVKFALLNKSLLSVN